MWRSMGELLDFIYGLITYIFVGCLILSLFVIVLVLVVQAFKLLLTFITVLFL